MSKGGGQSPVGDFLMRPEVLPWYWERAKGIADDPFAPYTGKLAPDMPTSLVDATRAATDVANFGARPITPAQVASTASVSPMMGLQGIDAYMNPFSQQVIDASMADIDRQRQMSLNQGASDAALSGAFGGDRHGVADSLTNEAFGRIAAETAAGLRMGGFDSASRLMQSDYDRALAASLANQNVGAAQNQQNAVLQLQASLANMSAAEAAQRANLAGAQTLGNLAQLQFGIEQMPLDKAYSEFLRQISYPAQTQDLLLKSLGGFGSMQGQWTPPSYPFGSSFLSSAGQGLGQGLSGGLNSYLWGS
jgi:hypothetical protein